MRTRHPKTLRVRRHAKRSAPMSKLPGWSAPSAARSSVSPTRTATSAHTSASSTARGWLPVLKPRPMVTRLTNCVGSHLANLLTRPSATSLKARSQPLGGSSGYTLKDRAPGRGRSGDSPITVRVVIGQTKSMSRKRTYLAAMSCAGRTGPTSWHGSSRATCPRDLPAPQPRAFQGAELYSSRAKTATD